MSSVKIPEVNPLTASWDMLTRGLHVDGPMIQGADGADIATTRIGRRRVFILGHPDHVDHVLHEGADAYHKSIEYELLRAVLGLNLFTDEDESWRRHRMLLNPMMAKRHVRGMVDLMADPVERYVDTLQGERIELEMAGQMVQLTMDVVGTALFGHRFGDVARKMQRVVTTGLRAAEVATRLLMVTAPPTIGIRAVAGTLHRLPVTLPQPLGGLQWVMHTVDDAVWELIDDRRAHPNDNDDLLNLLLNVRDEAGRPLPLKRVRDEVTTFMLAGHETTANALAWMWYLLALNPDARQRMLAEVDAVLEDRPPTVEDLTRLPWTTACFQEAMRFYPPAWVIPRVAVRDDMIAGTRIPKGATVIVPIHRIHHDERFWPDPEVFDPQRFMPGEGKDRHRSAYLPFGGGRRVCIGTSFALMETTLITAMLSQRYVFDLKPGHPVEPEATLTLRPRHGVRMIGRRRHLQAQAMAA